MSLDKILESLGDEDKNGDWAERLNKSRWSQNNPHTIWKYVSDKPKITLTEDIEQYVSEMVSPIIEKKRGEGGYKNDGGSIRKRHTTGKLGEIAVCVYLGLDHREVVDFSVGESADFDSPDLERGGLSIGVKTGSKEGDQYDYPLLKKPSITAKKHEYPQVIVMKEGLDFYICGIADVSVLNDSDNYSDTLIKSNDVTHKSAFKGFDKLIPLVPSPKAL